MRSCLLNFQAVSRILFIHSQLIQISMNHQSLITVSLLAVFFSLQGLYAQPADVPAKITWGQARNEGTNSEVTKVVDISKEEYVVLRERGETAFGNPKVFVESYDNNQKLKRSQELELKHKGKRRAFEDVVKIGGELYFFTSFNNQAQRINYLFYQKLSGRFVPSKQLVKIAELPAPNKDKPGEFTILQSSDSSKVLIYSQLDTKKREPEQFSLQVFDNQLNLIWKKDISLPYGEQQFAVEDYRIDENGDVYLLCVQYLEGTRDQRRGLPNYEYVVLAYTANGEREKEYRISLEGRFVSDLTFRFSRDGSLVCAGFYSEQGVNSIKGTCFFKIDTRTEALYDIRLSEFDLAFRTAFMSSGEQRRARRAEQEGNTARQAELDRFSLNELILRSDGGAVLVAEQAFMYERSYRYWDGTFRVDYYYNYNDIIIVNIRPDGSIEWSTRIPKLQETMNDGGYYSSYAMAVVRDRFYFIFNDNRRNFEGGGGQLFNFNGRNSIISLAEVRRDGSLEMYPLYDNREAGVITRPKICKQTGSRKMMVYGELGRQFRLGLLEFDPR